MLGLSGVQKGRHLRLGIKYQIENQGKSKNDLWEFIAFKAEFTKIQDIEKARSARIIYLHFVMKENNNCR